MKAYLLRISPPWLLRAYGRGNARVLGFVFRFRKDADLNPMQKFIRDGHNSLITRNLGLGESSVVLDFGGYVGDYSAWIWNQYHCRIDVFEPVPKFAAMLRKRFHGNPKIFVYEYAVAAANEARSFRMSSDGTGVFADGQEIPVEFRAASDVAEILPEKISLAAMNIEGGEYELIPALHSSGLLARIDRVFIQFHRVGADPEADSAACRALLSQTHTQEWEYEFVWESWVKKPA